MVFPWGPSRNHLFKQTRSFVGLLLGAVHFEFWSVPQQPQKTNELLLLQKSIGWRVFLCCPIENNHHHLDDLDHLSFWGFHASDIRFKITSEGRSSSVKIEVFATKFFSFALIKWKLGVSKHCQSRGMCHDFVSSPICNVKCQLFLGLYRQQWIAGGSLRRWISGRNEGSSCCSSASSCLKVGSH